MVRIWGNNVNEGNWEDETTENISCISTLEEAQNRTIRCCEWSPDDSMLACASFDGTVVIWRRSGGDHDFETWEQIAMLEGHDNEVKSVSWSFDGRLLSTCGRHKKVWIWESVGGGDYECVAMLDGHTQDVKFVKFDRRSLVLYSCSYDDTIKVWTVDEDDDEWFCAQTLVGHKSTVWGLSFQFNQPRIVSCSDDKTLQLWECEEPTLTGKWRPAMKVANVNDCPLYSVDWNQDHGYILSAGGDNCINVFQFLREGSETLLDHTFELKQAHENDINCIRWSPNSNYQHLSASAGDDGLVKIWTFDI